MPEQFRTISGKNKTIGQGIPQAFPIQLDPAPFEGAIVYADDGTLKYSDGVQWLDLGTGPQGVQGLQGLQGDQGTQGEYGPGFTIIGSVADVNSTGDPQALLNATFPGANIGEGVIDDLLDELWIYDGTNWVNIGSFRGVQGFQGIQGDQGVQGQLGEEGIQGSRGFIGLQGPQGVQGDLGIQGPIGFQGIQGFIGPQGSQGTQGDLGIQGDVGPQGIQGPQGTQGIQGIQGIQGPQGFLGPQGLQGDQGIQGNQGLQGNTGPQGIQGPQGTQGFQGPQGTQGLQGNTGPQGIQGFQGTDAIGTQGPTGIQGNTGPQGIQGNQGTQGNQGIQGFQGLQGNQGPQGTQGIQGDQGVQGLQGNTGPQGISGPQGIQGDLGIQGGTGAGGAQGAQGTQGNQGIQGNLGNQGVEGWAGGLSFYWEFSTNTTGGQFPGLNTWYLNNSNVTLATEMWIDDLAGSGRRIDELFNYLDAITSSPKGQIIIRSARESNGTYQYIIYEYTNWTWSVTGTGSDWGNFDINFIERSELEGTDAFPGTSWNAGAVVPTGDATASITFIPAGNQGAQGLQGFSGTQGTVGTGLPPFSFLYNYNTAQTTASDPGQTFFKTDSNFLSGTPEMYIDDRDVGLSNGIEAVLGYMSQLPSAPYGSLILSNANTASGDINTWFLVNGITDNTSWWTLDLEWESGSTDQTGQVSTYGPESVLTFIPSSPGLQGVQGPQGAQGLGGNTGAIGPMGGLSWEYNYVNTNTTASDPSFGNLKFNNALLASATALYIDDLDVYNQVFDTIIPALNGVNNTPKGYLTIVSKGFRGYYAKFSYTAFADQTGWWTINVQFESGDSDWTSIIAAEGNGVYITFQPTGDEGVQGDTGLQGATGSQGADGSEGNQGTQGIQGPQGNTGIQGVQGQIGSDGARIYQITNNGNTDYVVDGIGGNPDIILIRGFTYKFQINASGHPFYIKTDPGTGTGDQYNTGVTNNGEDNGEITFVVPPNAPSLLYYQCSTHAAMVGNIIISDLGPQGVQGPQGPQGPQGEGIQGASGGFGGVTFDYTFDTTTSTYPPFGSYDGLIRYNNATPSAATQIFIREIDDYGVSIEAYLRTIDDSTSAIKGHVKVTKKSDPAIFHIYTISGSTENNETHTIDVSYLNGNGTFVNSEDVTVTFARTGDSGDEGAQGTQGIQGDQGTDGFQGDVGFQGADGAGSQGTQGIQGNQGQAGIGAQGTQGIQGYRGEDGNQGFAGFQGPGGTGPQGIQGNQGTDAQGIQGNDGQAGASAGFKFAFDSGTAQSDPGTGNFRLNNGTQNAATAIYINNASADAGNPTVDGWLNSFGASTSNPKGYIVIKGTDNNATPDFAEFYIWPVTAVINQTTYVELTLSTLIDEGTQSFTAGDECFLEFFRTGDAAQGTLGSQGAQGFAGQVGTPGTQGAQGTQGTQGIQGFQGTDGIGGSGVQGIQGIQGHQGDTGTGAPGPQGIQGTQGEFGAQGGPGAGAPGAQGAQGIQGFQGIIGPEGGGGDPGIQGDTGIQGTQGPFGIGQDGVQGPEGPQGPVGTQGLDGDGGAEGAQGPRGFQGIRGDDGFQGPSGAGTPGAQGGDGPQGPAGLQGNGIQGPTGEGAQGPSGPPGGPGPQGDIGFQGEDGAQGNPGGDGAQGPNGFQGPVGSGAQGTDGSQGADGGPGPQGTTGTGLPGSQGPTGTDGIQGPTGSGTAPSALSGAPLAIRNNSQPVLVYDGSTTYYTSSSLGWTDATGSLTAANANLGTGAITVLTTGSPYEVAFTGDVDFSGATVTGLPGGATGWDGTTNLTTTNVFLRFADNADLQFGNSADISIEYQSTDELLISSVGSDTNKDITIRNSSTTVLSRWEFDTSEFFFERFGPLGAVDTDNERILFYGDVLVGVPMLYLETGFGTQNDTWVVTPGEFTTFNQQLDINGNDIECDDGDIIVRNSSNSIVAYMEKTGVVYAGTNFVSASDARLKENVITVDSALDKVMKLRGVYFNRIDDESKTRKLGVIAQETLEVLPEVVTGSEDNTYAVEYGNMAGLFIEAIKDLKAEVDALKAEIAELKNK